MAKIILYNPKEKTRLRIPYLPFSLMTVGSALQAAGLEVSLIDARVETNPKETILSLLKEDIVFFGITLITGSVIHDALHMAHFIKLKNPGIPVVCGGVHASLLPEQTAQHPWIDFVVIGPGENTSVQLAQALQKKLSFEAIPNLVYKKNGKIRINDSEDNSNMTPDTGINYDLVNLKKYLKTTATGNRCLDYLSSRGCPHSCSYCAISHLWRKRIFYYPAPKMLDDLERFRKDPGIDSIHFLDDNFFVNRERVETFCDAVIQKKLSLCFWSMCRIEYFSKYDDAFLRKLRTAGFCTMNFGAESGSPFILDKIKKGITVEQILKTARLCKQYGFRGQFSFMMGFPFEKDSDFEQTLALIDQIHAMDARFDIQLFPYTPFPRTELAEECLQYGYLPPEKLETWAFFEYGSIKMPWLSTKLRRKIDTLTTIAWFAFTSETAIKLGGWKGALFRLLGTLARFRWKHRFFQVPVEWKLINYLARH